MLLSACATNIVTNRNVLDCETLLPESLRAPTPYAPRPKTWTEGNLAAGYDANVGQIDLANAKARERAEFNARCKAAEVELVKTLTKRPWWKLF